MPGQYQIPHNPTNDNDNDNDNDDKDTNRP